MFTTGIGLVVSFAALFTLGTRTGLLLASVSATFFVYYFAVERGLAGGWFDARLARRVGSLIEPAVPVFATLMLIVAQGLAYTLGSWVPPLLFAWVSVFGVLRLRTWQPPLSGVIAALLFLIVVFGLGPVLDPSPLPSGAIYEAKTQLTRALTIVLSGAFSGVITWRVRSILSAHLKAAQGATWLGKYRLGPRISEGGMGRVYLADYCPEGGFVRRVAVKQIDPELAAHDAAIEAFRVEAQLGAHLHHPNVVAVLDFGRANGTFWLTMDHVDGIDLGELLAATRSIGRVLPEEVTAFIGLEIALGLQYAHLEALDEHGHPLCIAHRDVNPRNVLLSTAGEVKLTDFGVAAALGQSDARHPTAGGTPAYMAPEQHRGDAQDVRVDIYSLGVLLLEMLTGEHPVRSADAASTRRAILDDGAAAAVKHHGRQLGRWRGLLAQMVHQDANRRPSAREVVDELRLRKADLPPLERPSLAVLVRSVRPAEGPRPTADVTLPPLDDDSWLEEHAAPANQLARLEQTLIDSLAAIAERTVTEQARASATEPRPTPEAPRG
jgi:serine/threonine protein kinase